MTSPTGEVLVWALARHRRPDTLSRFQEKSYALLAKLQQQSAILRALTISDMCEGSAIPRAWEPYQKMVERCVWDEKHPTDYLNLTNEGRLRPDSLSKIGFSLSFVAKRGSVQLRLQGCSAGDETGASAVLRVDDAFEADVDAPDMLRRLLHSLLTQWDCSFGGVSHTKFEQVVKDGRASYAGQWLFYLPFPGLAKCLPPDIRHEPFANGILIETTPHMPDASNPADVAAGKRVRDVLDEFGLINDATYAIEGWPPDDEEAKYEQYISGAPAGRKYTVHCVNFDGYDPDRKVLLYAKLFRRLKRHPKEWGLRGWDGPVLNEAKRQVRAAEKAGGVPIEWHIGQEEPAHAVRQLLADHTNITEQQLRVIHTPLERAQPNT